MNDRKLHQHQLVANRSANSLTSPDGRSKAKYHAKQSSTSNKKARDKQVKVRSNPTTSMHRIVKQQEGPSHSLCTNWNKMEKDRNENGRSKKTIKTISRAHSTDKLRVKKHMLPRSIPTQSEHHDYCAFEEYFLFQNRIIPIINSDEKRVVNKYFNDSVSTQDKEWKLMENTCDIPKREYKECEVMTDSKSVGHLSSQTETFRSPTVNQQTITDPLPAPPIQIIHKKEKQELKFDQVLSKLQFLYLPEEKHFNNFSQIERQHYKDLFIMLAEKLCPSATSIDTQNIDVQTMQHNAMMIHKLNQESALYIQQRMNMQMSCVDTMVQSGIPTNIDSIISYLSNLFCYIDMQYKQEIVRGLNTFYGYFNYERFYLITHGKRPQPVQDCVLSQEIYENFEREFFMNEGEDPVVQQAIHIHNKVIFDSLNEQLNIFRPYFQSGGQPYIWNPDCVAVFSIQECDIEAVLQKAKSKIMESASYLCGLHFQHKLFQTVDSKGKKPQNLLLKEVHLDRERRLMINHIKTVDDTREKEDYRTTLMLEFGEILLAKIIHQESLVLMRLFS